MKSGTTDAPPRVQVVTRLGKTFTRRARSTALERNEHGLAGHSAGCRCGKCVAGRNRYDRERRAAVKLLEGQVVRRRVPPARTAEAIHQLRAEGWSMGAIAEAAGCCHGTLTRVLRSARLGKGRVWSDIEARVLELAGD